jgi:glycosyltransferase involved in cell wall biosynthesis
VKPKYAFIKIRSRHTIIEQIIRILEYTFPYYEIEIIDIKKILIKNFHVMVINLFYMLHIYGIRTLLAGKNTIYNRFFGTPYMYQNINRLLRLNSRNDYLFSIQDCSLFNGKLNGIPHFVYTDHTVLANRNYPGFNKNNDLLSDAWMALEGEIYRNADIVFTRSKIVRESVIDDYQCSPEKVQCIYYAPFIKDRERSQNQTRYASKQILFVGLEWERKGGPILVSAFERVIREVPDARLTIVGCNPSLNVKNVEIVGPIAQEEMRKYYEESALFCLPTRQEPFGIAFIEAMSYGLPVIGTSVGALPEFIIEGDNGYLIQVNDEESLACLLIDLLSDPERCELMGRRGYDIYRQKFTLDVVSSSLKKHITPYIKK